HQKLRNERTGQVARGEAAKQSTPSDTPAGSGSAEVAEPGEIVRGELSHWVARIVFERNVAEQGHPVEFDNFAGLLGAAEGGGWGDGKLVGVGAFQIKCLS